jgi:hypothetical protein
MPSGAMLLEPSLVWLVIQETGSSMQTLMAPMIEERISFDQVLL